MNTEEREIQKDIQRNKFVKVQRSLNSGLIPANEWLTEFLNSLRENMIRGFLLSKKQLDILDQYIRQVEEAETITKMISNNKPFTHVYVNTPVAPLAPLDLADM